MHSLLITATLLAAGVTARDLRARAGGDSLPILPDFLTPKFHAISPEDGLAALMAKAKSDPKAVTPVAGLPFSLGSSGVVSNFVTGGSQIQDGPTVGLNIPNPLQAGNKEKRASSCTNPEIHVEWNNASPTQQQAFVAALQCLQTKPARSGLKGTKTRWDDLAAIHQTLNTQIHGVGQFVPWHRYFLWILEQEMRNTCGFTNSMLWWDETKAAGNFQNAAIFQSAYFGDAPDGSVRCVTTGAFHNMTCDIGPGSSDTAHCLSRGVNEKTTAGVSASYVKTCQSYNDFNDMQSCVDFGPHALGHNGIGGVMSDVQSSPQDPIFFMHHGFVDHIWRLWQVANPNSRTYAIGGYIEQNCNAPSSSCQPTTLTYQMNSAGFYPPVTVDQVMNTEGGFLCYHYDY